MGLWLLTTQTALIPQVPGQGSWQVFRMQAWLTGQSLLRMHSGLHDTLGSPT
jgi:hypothetical protein